MTMVGTAVVLGGGMSGLSAAYYLQKLTKARFSKIILLESGSRLGGWVKTTCYPDGTIFEHGPRSMRPVGNQGVNSLELAEELGLSNKIIPCLSSSPAAKNRFIYVNGQMCSLPNSAKSLFRKQAPFSKALVWSGVREMFKKKSDLEDETVDDFMARRFDKEIANYAMNPLCRGIFAGNSQELSMRACFPDIFQMEKQHGSLIRGMMKMSRAPKPEFKSEMVKRAKSEKWSSWTLQKGLQHMTETIADAAQQGGVEIRMNTKCTGIEPLSDGKIKVTVDGEEINADQVISSLSAKEIGRLLPKSHKGLSDRLQSIPAVSVVVVNVEYDSDCLPREGFGHLLPATESGPLLGVIYDSCTFPEHNKQDSPSTTRLTVMMGGAWFEALTKDNKDLREDIFETMALEALEKQLNIAAKPSRTLVTVQKECIPQYLVGHSNNINRIDQYLRDHKLPLCLVGSSYRGPSLNDCINNARVAIQKLASLLQCDTLVKF